MAKLNTMTKDEANEILHIMDYQQEMFLGGLNDELMSTTLGSYKELRDDFDKVRKAYSNLKMKIARIV